MFGTMIQKGAHYMVHPSMNALTSGGTFFDFRYFIYNIYHVS